MATLDHLQSPEYAESPLEFETLISDVSRQFIDLPADEVDGKIQDALRQFCEFLGIDFAVLWQWSAIDPRAIVATHTYPAQDDPQLPSAHEHYPWSVQQMLAGNVIKLASLEGAPEEAAVDIESARLLGVKSNLTLPLTVGGEPPVGSLAFNALRAECDWPDAQVKRLQLVAQVFTNALARRRHEQSLRESRQRLALAAESAGAGGWTLDFDTGVFWAAETAREIFGYSKDEVVDMERFMASVHAEDRDRVRGAVEQSARTGEPAVMEYRITPTGEDRVRWVASRGRPQLDSSGKPERLMGLSVDVTDRKRDEEALRASEVRLAAGADLAGLASYEVDFETGTMNVDDRLREICGVPPESQGLQVLEFWMEHLHPDDRERVADARQDLHDGRVEQLSIEYRYLHPTHGERWLHHVAGVARRDATGHAVKTYGVFRDTTQRRQREEALRESHAEIERLKDRLQAESEYLKAEIKVVHPHGEVTGQSRAIQEVLRAVGQVAPTGSSVLIRGETGSGKELMAQAIHRLSPRQSELLVKVNCAALPSGLVESELFGREKGAFTGALTRQVGRFEVADGSTLFLDEVGELSPEVQAKLLRVLETGEFERLGSPKTIQVDVRLIAATNRDLVEDVRTGRFREDLYYRLNVFPIRVPPLRERVEDIPQLVWAFLEEFSARMGKKITHVPRKTMEALRSYPWPGNVRELRNVIEHSAIVTADDTLKVPMLDDVAAAAPAEAPLRTLAESERELILRALERSGGHVKGPKGAAVALGLKPSTLYSRMKKLGIRPPGPTARAPA